MALLERLDKELAIRKKQGNYRELPLISYRQDNIIFDDITYVDLASNDYLCIAKDMDFLKEFYSTMMDSSHGNEFANHILFSSLGLGSTGSRLLTGNHNSFCYCEDLLADLFNGSAACSCLVAPLQKRVLKQALPHLLQDYQKVEALPSQKLKAEFIEELQDRLNLATKDSLVNSSSLTDIENNWSSASSSQELKQNESKTEATDASEVANATEVTDETKEAEATEDKQLNQASLNTKNIEENKTSSSYVTLSALEHSPYSEQVSSSLYSSTDSFASLNLSSSNNASFDSRGSTNLEEHKKNGEEAFNTSRIARGLGHDLVSEIEQDLITSTFNVSDIPIDEDVQQLLIPQPKVCLYINSGFDANVGILSTLFTEKDLLLVDKLAHASIIDGMLKSKAKAIRFKHNDLEHLTYLIEQNHDKYENIVVVTESVFSMDGDRAPLSQMVALKQKYTNLLLYVDEAHSFGVLGEDGLGLCKELNILHKVDFIMCTLSKAIGSQGAFLICDKLVKEYLINCMRPLIFATALPPINVTFSLYVIGLLKTTPMQYKREYLKKISHYLHLNLLEMDLKPSQSQIQPLITGSNENAIKASHIFRSNGLLALPIRHPTVPKNEARLRICLHSNLRIDDLEKICSLVRRYRSLFL